MTETHGAKLPQILFLTNEVSKYMQQKFKSNLLDPKTYVPYPDRWSLDFLIDCNRAVYEILDAFRNRVHTEWDIEQYASHISTRNYGQNAKRVPQADTHADVRGNGLVWYLPDMITPARQQRIWKVLLILEPALRVAKSSSNWRIGGRYYREPDNYLLKPGTASFAPAWFELGHDSNEYLMKVSASLVQTGPAAHWLEEMTEHSALLGAALSITNPMQYEAGIKSLQALYSNPELVETPERLLQILSIWSAPFHGISVISNRITMHRDVNGVKEWFDLLVALGTYQEGWLELGGLGVKCQYRPGTTIFLAGGVMTHSANCDGDRACIAFYIRQKVYERLQLPEAQWYRPGEIHA